MSYYENVRDEEAKQDTIKCVIWSIVITIGMLALTAHGIAFLSWTEPTMEEYYARRRMQNQIEDLYQWRTGMVIEYEKHTHGFWGGRIKK